MILAGGICAALFHRGQAGAATVVDVSLLASGMWAMGAAIGLSQLVSAEFAKDTFENWKLRLKDLRGQWAPVQDTVNIADDPMVRANGYLLGTVSHDGVPFTMVSTPVMFDKEQRAPGRAPAFNEHGDEILARELGLDEEAIIALKIAGVVA